MSVEHTDIAQEMIRQRTLVKQVAPAGSEWHREEVQHRTTKRKAAALHMPVDTMT
ncbi:hypothetical protein MesoLj113c_48910 [Mesorhizobium sp. 113-3-9]|nr:hypothetical protein MesoLj113c_48910 [Mesorhizobium sp. 113-3-9]